MDNKHELRDFLSEKMSLEDLNLQTPRLSLVEAARNKVMARKKQSNELNDFFSLVAAFLNFKIKLYHAVIIAILTSGIILFATHSGQEVKEESQHNAYVSNIASVRSSTVLSGIYTLGLSKTQYDGSNRN